MSVSAEEQIIAAIRRITQAVDLWSRDVLQQCGLTSPQLAVLREIVSGRSATPTSIADALHLTQPTVTGILQRLERAGLISRQRSDDDRRSVIATITPRGSKVALLSPKSLRERVRKRLQQLPQERQTSLLAEVLLLASMMDAPDDSQAGPVSFQAASPLERADARRRKRRQATRGRA